MKMQPDQGCCHPGLPGDGLCYDGLHDLLRLGARMVVELWEQAIPRVSVDSAGEEDGRNQAEHQQATHGSRHVSNLCCTALHYVASRRRELLFVCFYFSSCGWRDEAGMGWHI
uniref:Uncharacterized protein n=1 Tax=Oryza brachyantha TaxID=4533 RepID=J3KYI7_ORYBR